MPGRTVDLRSSSLTLALPKIDGAFHQRERGLPSIPMRARIPAIRRGALPERHDGQNTCSVIQKYGPMSIASGKNKSVYVNRNIWFKCAIPPRHGGRDGHSSPDVRRAAMDAVVPQDVRHGRVRSSRVVLSPRRWGQVVQSDCTTTVAKKPDTPGRARSSRKTIAQGVPE